MQCNFKIYIKPRLLRLFVSLQKGKKKIRLEGKKENQSKIELKKTTPSVNTTQKTIKNGEGPALYKFSKSNNLQREKG